MKLATPKLCPLRLIAIGAVLAMPFAGGCAPEQPDRRESRLQGPVERSESPTSGKALVFGKNAGDTLAVNPSDIGGGGPLGGASADYTEEWKPGRSKEAEADSNKKTDLYIASVIMQNRLRTGTVPYDLKSWASDMETKARGLISDRSKANIMSIIEEFRGIADTVLAAETVERKRFEASLTAPTLSQPRQRSKGASSAGTQSAKSPSEIRRERIVRVSRLIDELKVQVNGPDLPRDYAGGDWDKGTNGLVFPNAADPTQIKLRKY